MALQRWFCRQKLHNISFISFFPFNLVWLWKKFRFLLLCSKFLLYFCAMLYTFPARGRRRKSAFRAHSTEQKEERIKSETLTYICHCFSKLMVKKLSGFAKLSRWVWKYCNEENVMYKNPIILCTYFVEYRLDISPYTYNKTQNNSILR